MILLTENTRYYTPSASEEENFAFVLKCEAEFEEQLDSAIGQIKDRLLADRHTRVITLSGPTCSGKTTTAGKLIDELEHAGLRVMVVSLDDFFKSVDCNLRSYSSKNEDIDLDSVDAIDIDYLKKFILGIFAGEKVYLPRFDFAAQRCVGYTMIESDGYDVFLLEGIQAVYPAVRALLEGQDYISIFTCVKDGIDIDGVRFASREIRFMRRLLRDRLFRSASIEFTVQVWDSVVKNEEESILPNAHYADISLNSTLVYEPCVIKRPLLGFLREVGKDYPLYSTVKELIDKLEALPEISSRAVPHGSVFREFIGEENNSEQ